MKKVSKILLVAIIALTANIALAQSNRTHVVERGETLESIAKKYGVTKDEIVSLNPDLSQFIYVGMELSIPAPTQVTPARTQSPQSTQSSQPYLSDERIDQIVDEVINDMDKDTDFSSLGFGYYAIVNDAFDRGAYGLNWYTLKHNAVGMHLFLGTDLGLVDKAGFWFKGGPNYAYQLSEQVMFHTPLTFDGYSYQKENPFENEASKMKFYWALSVTPSLAVKIGGVRLNCGIGLTWTEAKSVDATVMLGIGFNFE